MPNVTEVEVGVGVARPGGGAMPVVSINNQRFRMARRMLDLSQEEVAEGIGIGQPDLSNFEKSVRPLSERNRKKLVTFLKRRLEAAGIKLNLVSDEITLEDGVVTIQEAKQ